VVKGNATSANAARTRSAQSVALAQTSFRAWPEGLADYVADHAVRLPDKFVTHVLSEIASYEIAGQGESWWRAVTEPD
jgi:hypothetical protein